MQLQRLCYAANMVKPCLCVKFLVNNRRSSTDEHTSHGYHVVPENLQVVKCTTGYSSGSRNVVPLLKTKKALAGGRGQIDSL